MANARIPSLPYRQIHLDFHTSEHIPNVGGAFDPTAFVRTLQAGHVNSVTLFAKCHHGWSYYPTQLGQPHPNLVRPDLLGEMIAACRQANIQTPVYITVQFDELTAREHPEWRVVRARHAVSGAMGQSGGDADLNMLDPQWHPLSLVHDELVDRIIAQAIEVVERYDPEGIFMDILLLWEDVGPKSLQRMERRGLDPEKRDDRLQNDTEVLFSYYERFRDALQSVKPGLRIFHNSGHIAKGDRGRWPYFTHLELESLPTGGWGYDHFPVSAKYTETLGMEFLGMTGKFHTTWGEFGGYKRPVALEYECAQMIAMGARCSVGDQLHPSGKLDEPTYRGIGQAYAAVEQLEPFLTDSEPVSEIAVLSPEAMGRSGERHIPEEYGAARMLLELHQQFTVIDTETPLDPFKLLVLPDTIRLEGPFLESVSHWLRSGGRLIASGRSLLNPEASGFLLDFPAEVGGCSPFHPDYLRVDPSWDRDLVESPFVVYERSWRFRATGQAEPVADVHDPYFNRTWRHFCSHQHAPARPEPNGFHGILATGQMVVFAHPVFTAYERSGQPLLKYAFRGALERLLPNSLMRTNLPSSARVFLRRQARQNRHLLHLYYAQTQLRGSGLDGLHGRQHMEILEDAVPLHEVEIDLRLAETPTRAYSARSGAELAIDLSSGGCRVRLPRIDLHEVVVLE